MPSIDKINIWNSASRQNIKNTLGYAVRKRHGYYKDIKMVDERRGDTLDSFESAGFVHIGQTLKERTFGITDLGDQYYKDVFGKFDYWGKRLAGLWDKIKADLKDRLEE